MDGGSTLGMGEIGLRPGAGGGGGGADVAGREGGGGGFGKWTSVTGPVLGPK